MIESCQLLSQADEEDALESRRLREALAESQAKEAAMGAQEVNLRQQLCSAQSQTRLLHELQQKLCEVSAWPIYLFLSFWVPDPALC